MKLRCVHLSDIHWRGLSRHEEYRETFEGMFSKVRELNPNLIFIGGDILHTKTQGISPEIIDCLNWWFTEMAKICPVHVILGNHDGLIMNKDRQDAISPIINALNSPNIHLYKKSGVYPTGIPGFNWCVFSCFDEEGWPTVKPAPGEINIATFHGGVLGSVTDIDWDIDGEIDVSFFKDYDFAFLGDIHKLQYLDPEKRVAYPGSTIQQNYGEGTGKGFLFWEIDSRDEYRSTFYEVAHSKPFVTVEWGGTVPETVKNCLSYPIGTRYRIRTSSQISHAEMKQLFGELKELRKPTEIVFKDEQDKDTKTAVVAKSQYSRENLRNLQTQISLMKDFYSTVKLSEDEWKSLEMLTAKYFNAASHSDCVRNIKWSIKKLQFDNVFSYGKGNLINFDSLKGITGIFGRNRAGKSSIPGTIMYGLYNTTDRGAMSNLHVINMRKGHCEVKMDISANGDFYRLERQSVRKNNRSGGESAVTQLNFYSLDEDGNIIKDLNGEQRRDTEKFLRAVVGTADDFLMTSLASQGEMNTFINHKASARKTILTKFLDLEIFDEMCSLAKADAAAAKALLSNVPDRDWDAMISDLVTEKSTKEKEKIEAERALDVLRLKLQKAQIDLATFNTKSLVTQEDVDEKAAQLEAKRNELLASEAHCASLSKEVTSIEEKITSISELKKQFPISDLKSRFEERQDLERSLLELKHALETEKNSVSVHKKSLKLLEEVPCGDKYPTCKFIKSSHESRKKIPSHESKVTELVDRIAASAKTLTSLDRENLKEKIEKYNQVLEKERDGQIRLSTKEIELTKANNKTALLKSMIQSLEDDLNSMRLRVSSSAESDRLRAARKVISDLTSDINEKDAQRIGSTQMIGTLESKIERAKSEKEKYTKLISDWRIYEIFIGAVSKNGIPLKIMSTMLPAINDEISKILQGVAGFTVELVADPDTNEMEIYLNYGDSKRIVECGSGMEKMMASLAIRVALINTTTLPKSDMLIIDEGFGALDDMNVESCTRLLRSLKHWFKNILVISHVDAVKDAVDSVLDITHKEMNANVFCE